LIPSDSDWGRRFKASWYARAKVVDLKIEPAIKEAPFGQLKSAVMSLEAKALELKAEHRGALTLVHDTEEDRKVMESAIAQGKFKLLLLTGVEVIKKTFSRRARGLVAVES
jgi:hypothetical protein